MSHVVLNAQINHEF